MGSGSNNNTTLEDLARLAGVSVSTVSRALNDQPLISTRTKQRIWALAREHNYPFRHYMPAGPIGAEGSIAIVTPPPVFGVTRACTPWIQPCSAKKLTPA